uniref:Uncharacterized protein n=1 Tax=Papio anubis TaxID=9555 RepID=A0A8I5NI33_PAPAN
MVNMQSFPPSSRLKCSDVTILHCSPDRVGSSSPPTTASLVVVITGVHHHARLIFVEKESHCIAQAGVELLGSSNSLILASQSVGITGASHCAWTYLYIFEKGQSSQLKKQNQVF